MAFGLHIESEFDLPELPQINIEGDQQPDLVIKKADLSLLWTDLAEANKYFVIKENLLMFHVPNAAIYLIQNGKEMYVSPVEGVSEDVVRLYILGSCMGAMLMQRKVLPLHGSAIEIDGKVYAIVGESGAGKSTLASAFLKRGYYLLSDDIIPVTLSEEQIPIVTPAYPQQKLWLESLNQFEMEPSLYRPIHDRETKFAVPVTSQFVSEPLPLAGVFELVKSEKEEIDIQPIKKLERLSTLFTHTYRNFFINESGLMAWHFHLSTKIIEKINLYQLRRPATRFTAHDLTELIVKTVKEEEKTND